MQLLFLLASLNTSFVTKMETNWRTDGHDRSHYLPRQCGQQQFHCLKSSENKKPLCVVFASQRAFVADRTRRRCDGSVKSAVVGRAIYHCSRRDRSCTTAHHRSIYHPAVVAAADDDDGDDPSYCSPPDSFPWLTNPESLSQTVDTRTTDYSDGTVSGDSSLYARNAWLIKPCIRSTGDQWYCRHSGCL